MAIDHDKIFKRLIQSFFREFIELFLPHEASLIDFDRVEFLEQEYFTDMPRGTRKRLDLVVKVGLKSGGEQFVLVHVEFQSGRETDFPKRVYLCFNKLFERHDRTVVPVAVFTDDAKWRKPVPDTYSIGLGTHNYMEFRYRLIKLKHLDYRKFLEADNPLAFALMAKMDYNKRQRVRLKAEFLRLILGKPIDPARKSLLLEFVETYIPLKRNERTKFDRIVAEKPEYREVKKMITVYERQGIRKGRLEGKQEGKIEGKQASLLLLLEEKFGKVTSSLKGRIRRINSEEKLDSLLTAALKADSVDQVQP